MSGIGSDRLAHNEDEQRKTSLDTEADSGSNNPQVKTQGGRDFNVLSDTYTLPADAIEWDRLETQHRAITLALGGLYPAPEVVRAVLVPEGGVTKRILDLGCGTGTWSTEMAREFPHCEILGIDLAPAPLPPNGLPPNCRFERHDISLGLSHLQDQFHLVFARLVALGLKDFRKTLADAIACLKPGGILISIDAEFGFYSGWPMVYRFGWSTSNPTGSYATRLFTELKRLSISLFGSDAATMERILDEGFWTNADALDPETCKAAGLYLPVGPWCDTGAGPLERERVKKVGLLMQQDVIETPKTVSPLLLIKAGLSKETVDRWSEGLRNECLNDTLGFRLRIAWGRRREGPNLPSPALIPRESEIPAKNVLLEIYETQQQASAAAAVRNRGKDIPTLPNAP